MGGPWNHATGSRHRLRSTSLTEAECFNGGPRFGVQLMHKRRFTGRPNPLLGCQVFCVTITGHTVGVFLAPLLCVLEEGGLSSLKLSLVTVGSLEGSSRTIMKHTLSNGNHHHTGYWFEVGLETFNVNGLYSGVQ